MKTLAVIPARFASTRFPGKVLCDLFGKPVIQWVYEQALKSCADEVIVGTDDEKVLKAVQKFGGNAIMTSPEHPSGTDRVWEVVQKSGSKAEIIVNIQGDEPLIPPSLIDKLIAKMKSDSGIPMATVAVPVERSEIDSNPNVVKTVIDKQGFALYFSRAPVPFLREGGQSLPLYRHWGIYAFRKNTLQKFIQLPQSPLEKCEKLEQLRALDNGIKIFVVITQESEGIGVDTPQDLEELKKILKGGTQSRPK